jgi:prepilin-type N-terminal cleavage/methylation domain-containing protein
MKGFTLIEMMVSVAIFSVVMVIALGALLAISTSDRKAESLKAVINNLNFAVDSMSRSIRTGNSWGCDVNHTLSPVAGADCNTSGVGANEIVFTSSAGIVTYYRLESLTTDPANAAAVCNQVSPNVGCIAKSINGGIAGSWLPITSPEVVIQDCSAAGGCSGSGSPSYLFYMVGSPPGPNTVQPNLRITLSGYVQVTGGATSLGQCSTVANPTSNQCSIFHLQTSVTQRIYDQ